MKSGGGSEQLVALLNNCDYLSSTSDVGKFDWLFEYDGFAEFFHHLNEIVTLENVISNDLITRYDDLCQTNAEDVLPSADALEVLGSLARLSAQSSEKDSFPEQILSSSSSSDLMHKEYQLLLNEVESLKKQVQLVQGQAQVERLAVVKKEDLLKQMLRRANETDDAIEDAADQLEGTKQRMLTEVCQLGSLYDSMQNVDGVHSTSGLMGGLPFRDIYKMEEDFATKFTAYTRKQLGHKGVIKLSNSANESKGKISKPVATNSSCNVLTPTNQPSSRSSSACENTTNNNLDYIRNEELQACFKALTPARPSNSNAESKRLSFMRPGRLLASRFSNHSVKADCENMSPDGRISVYEMTVIIQEIYSTYGLALMERSKSVMEREKLAGKVAFLEQFHASIEQGQLSNILPHLDVSMTRSDKKLNDLKLKLSENINNGLSQAIDRLVTLLVESVHDCGLDIELKRKEYVLDKREKVIGYLKQICSRGLLIRLLLEQELASVSNTLQLGNNLLEELKNGEKEMLNREAHFSRTQCAIKGLPKYAVDSVNTFLHALFNALRLFSTIYSPSFCCLISIIVFK